MADITDPQVIKFSNENLRPLAEDLRRVKAALDDAEALYNLEISGLLSGNVAGDPVIDGRVGQGVTVLTKGDINAFLQVLNTLKTDLDVAGVSDTILKPCVRPLFG